MTRTEINQLIDLRERQHLPIATIAAQLGMKPNTVCSRIFSLRKRGLITYTAAGPNTGINDQPRQWTPKETHTKILEYVGRGMTNAEIGVKLDLTARQVRHRIDTLRDKGHVITVNRAAAPPKPKRDWSPPRQYSMPASVITRRMPIAQGAGGHVWREGECRWPLTCAEPAAGGNWCATHGAMVGRRAA